MVAIRCLYLGRRRKTEDKLVSEEEFFSDNIGPVFFCQSTVGCCNSSGGSILALFLVRNTCVRKCNCPSLLGGKWMFVCALITHTHCSRMPEQVLQEGHNPKPFLRILFPQTVSRIFFWRSIFFFRWTHSHSRILVGAINSQKGAL